MKKLGFLCAVCASVLSVNSVLATDGALVGKFTINANGDQVCFAKGNLQFQASTKTWRLAENQWDVVGVENAKIAADNAVWIDLFGWGTGNEPAKATSEISDYDTIFVDWGKNAISNGGNKANLWRTLSREEWGYIFINRKNAADLIGAGSVNGVNGLILLPDDWKIPEGVTFNAAPTKGLVAKGSYYKNAQGDNFTHNVYTAEQWKKMESAGAVFLPAAGYRYEADARKVGANGNYWTSTVATNEGTDEGEAKNIDFDKGYVGFGISGRLQGFSVRLACKVAVDRPAPPVKPVKPVRR